MTEVVQTAGRRTRRKSAEPPEPIERQAVVVIHGQGEQRPMGTIRDIVKVLWQFNPELGSVPGDKDADPRGRPIWIVPDDKSGLYELQRVTTPVHNGRRTDFFELYYADLLNATPLRNLWRWLRRLLWIDPADVPDRMRLPWTMFWLLSLVAFGTLVMAVLSLPELLRRDWFGVVLAPESRLGLSLILGALAVLLAPKFFRFLSFMEVIPLSLVLLVIAIGVMQIGNWNARVIAVLVLIVLVYLSQRMLLPYFGDAASYLSARTETVQSRQVVRNRGLELLKALHDDPNYDRIVIVGHSLGTVLAYDLLHILWQEVGPTKDNPPEPQAVETLEAVDRFVAAAPKGAWSDEEVEHYQDLQWRAFDTLRRQAARPAGRGRRATPAGWKISDFVALGSPLASAQFLITESREDFQRMKGERVLPTAPAQPYNARHQALYIDERGRKAAHHGAVFSTVRWTNIYDEFSSPFFLLGDPIAGPCAGPTRFGSGVKDRNVAITSGPLKSRFFTHSLYWTETSDDWMKPTDHISAFRAAVGLERKPPKPDAA